MIFLLCIAAVLVLLAIFSIRRQVGVLRSVHSQSPLPSDDRTYLRRQAYRRVLIGVLMMVLAGMLAGAYLSGMEKRSEQFGNKEGQAGDGARPALAPDDREFARFYVGYWIVVLVLLFVVVSLAIVDLWATRRYAWDQLRRIQSENRTILERDLAMYRQQKINDRMRKVE